MIGYGICGSFCTHAKSLDVLKKFCGEFDVCPIVSENVYSTDTRFGTAEALKEKLVSLTGHEIIHNVREAEPLGPKCPLEALIVCPCTGNTLAKIANGITDTAVTMAVKAHLRTERPLLIALASNDAMSSNLSNISTLLNRKNVFFVPMVQDDPKNKPSSLVADFSKVEEAFEMMQKGVQLRPLFLS